MRSLVTTDDDETLVLTGIEDVETCLVLALRGIGQRNLRGNVCPLDAFGAIGLALQEIDGTALCLIDANFLSHGYIYG